MLNMGLVVLLVYLLNVWIIISYGDDCKYTIDTVQPEVLTISATGIGTTRIGQQFHVMLGADRMDDKVVILASPSHYFKVENRGYYQILTKACLPAGHVESILLMIEGEAACNSINYTTIRVGPTDPKMNNGNNTDNIEVNISECSETIDIHKIQFQPLDCNPFSCIVDCRNCNEPFWVTEDFVIQTTRDGVNIGFTYSLDLLCFDCTYTEPLNEWNSMGKNINVTFVGDTECEPDTRLVSSATSSRTPEKALCVRSMTSTRTSASITPKTVSPIISLASFSSSNHVVSSSTLTKSTSAELLSMSLLTSIFSLDSSPPSGHAISYSASTESTSAGLLNMSLSTTIPKTSLSGLNISKNPLEATAKPKSYLEYPLNVAVVGSAGAVVGTGALGIAGILAAKRKCRSSVGPADEKSSEEAGDLDTENMRV